jgi:hypothetical protein
MYIHINKNTYAYTDNQPACSDMQNNPGVPAALAV